MITHVEIGKKEYPLNFGMKALDEFCRRTKRTMNDLMNLGTTLMPMDGIILAHCAMKDGARLEKVPFTLDEDGLADLVDENKGSFELLMNAFAESQAPTEPAEKKIPEEIAPAVELSN